MLVARRRPPPDEPKPDPKPVKRGATWIVRREYIQSHSLARDLAEWLTIIAKAEGRQLGLTKFTVTELLDPILRPWAWERVRPLLEKKYGTKLSESPPTPDPRAVRPRPAKGS